MTKYIIEALHNKKRVETKNPEHQHMFTGKSHNNSRGTIIS